MKTMIVYASRHHGSTEKLVQHLAAVFGLTLHNAEASAAVDYAGYDLIGFASGIDFGKFYPSVTQLAAQLPPDKQVFALYTCARDQAKYGSEIASIAAERGCTFLGKYGCRGYNTYGPWKLIGGMNKQHPDVQELEAAVRFFGSLQE